MDPAGTDRLLGGRESGLVVYAAHACAAHACTGSGRALDDAPFGTWRT